ncbi:MAG TPA: glycosyltransferase [Stellaceae bacterium]|nr:glycosyltransferase [Stellaceae bacterium]
MIALDLSRLLSRAGSAAASGIDRVELAYARHLAAGRLPPVFAARNVLGGVGLLPAMEAQAFVAALGRSWHDGATRGERRHLVAQARRLRRAALFGGPALRRALRVGQEPPVYLVVSHSGLDRGAAIARLKAASGASFVCLIHDLIPLEQPALTRPDQVRRHVRRIDTVARLADAAIVNSAATGDALRARLGRRNLPIVVAPLGIDLPDVPPAAAERPYFIVLGRIEPRKNHRLLLEIWMRLAAELGERAPQLAVIGRRGYRGKAIARELGDLPGFVALHGELPDRAMGALLRGARALLLPSFAEGFGLPVAEALAAGVPVLCSDLPALRESGGGIPDYLDPADREGWHRAILDFAVASSRRDAQLARLEGWRPPGWAAHFAIVARVIASLG